MGIAQFSVPLPARALEQLQEAGVQVGGLVVNRVLLCTLLGLGLDGFWRLGQDNGAVNLAHYENGSGSVLGLNDTCHLQE